MTNKRPAALLCLVLNWAPFLFFWYSVMERQPGDQNLIIIKAYSLVLIIAFITAIGMTRDSKLTFPWQILCVLSPFLCLLLFMLAPGSGAALRHTYFWIACAVPIPVVMAGGYFIALRWGKTDA